MKQIKPDEKIEKREESAKARKQAEREAREQSLDEFRKSSAYRYVMQFFTEYEEKIIKEIESIQSKEMKTVFMLPKAKQLEKIAEMSKRDSVLTAVLAVLKLVKGKL